MKKLLAVLLALLLLCGCAVSPSEQGSSVRENREPSRESSTIELDERMDSSVSSAQGASSSASENRALGAESGSISSSRSDNYSGTSAAHDLLGNPFPPSGEQDFENMLAFRARFNFYDYTPSPWEFDLHGPFLPTQESYDFCMSPAMLEIARQYELPDCSSIKQLGTNLLSLTDQSGRTFIWGYNSLGVIGDGTDLHRHLPHCLPFTTRQIAAGGGRCFAVTPDGAVYGWGRNYSGDLGLGEDARLTMHFSPEPIPFEKPIRKISTRLSSTLALAEDGTVYRSGLRGEEFRHFTDVSIDPYQPHVPLAVIFERLETPEKAVDIACGGTNYVIAGESGKVYTVGLLGDDEWSHTYGGWTAFSFPAKIRQVYASSDYFFALDENGVLYGYGRSTHNRVLYPMDKPDGLTERPIVLLENVRSFCESYGSCIAVTNDGSCLVWGRDESGNLGLGKKYADSVVASPLFVALPEPAAAASFASGIGMALGESGQVYVWGKNDVNQRLEPGFTPESVRDIPFEERVGDEWTIYEPVPMGKAVSGSVFEGKSAD